MITTKTASDNCHGHMFTTNDIGHMFTTMDINHVLQYHYNNRSPFQNICMWAEWSSGMSLILTAGVQYPIGEWYFGGEQSSPTHIYLSIRSGE